MITDLSHRARYGTAHGVFGTIYDVGAAAEPIVAGMLVARSLIVAAAFHMASRTDRPD